MLPCSHRAMILFCFSTASRRERFHNTGTKQFDSIFYFHHVWGRSSLLYNRHDYGPRGCRGCNKLDDTTRDATRAHSNLLSRQPSLYAVWLLCLRHVSAVSFSREHCFDNGATWLQVFWIAQWHILFGFRHCATVYCLASQSRARDLSSLQHCGPCVGD